MERIHNLLKVTNLSRPEPLIMMPLRAWGQAGPMSLGSEPPGTLGALREYEPLPAIYSLLLGGFPSLLPIEYLSYTHPGTSSIPTLLIHLRIQPSFSHIMGSQARGGAGGGCREGRGRWGGALSGPRLTTHQGRLPGSALAGQHLF